MTVTVPAKDAVHFAMQADITQLNTVIGNTTNGKQKYELTKLMAQRQLALVQSLLATGNLSASTALSSLSYVAAQPGGDQG